MEEPRIPRMTSAWRVRLREDQIDAAGMDPAHPSPQRDAEHGESPLTDRRNQLRALLTLERIPGLGPVGIRALLDREGGACEALAAAGSLATPEVVRNAAREAEHVLHAMERLARERPEWNSHIIGIGLQGYPVQLMDLPDPPPILFSIGELDLLKRPAVAIVGTRRSSRYGDRVARTLAGTLARAGACIVSGMATGVDGIAHGAALDCGGSTIGVLGTGIDVAYPAAHRALHDRIATSGLLLSEHPPGERAGPGAFPRRNRIIAALAQLTVVVEAGLRSGALLTAGHALEIGRTVAAVPGQIDSPESSGANALVRDGAQVIADVTDALCLMGLTPPARRAGPHLSGDARAVYDAVGTGSVRVEDLPARLALPVERCLAAITELELEGAVICDITGEVTRRS
jgi:DNA processing protein